MDTALFRRIIVFSFVVSTAGATSVDSLKARMRSATGAERYDLAFRIAYDLFDVDNPEAVKYAEEAFGLAKQLGDSATIVRSGRIYGQLLWRVGELVRSIELMETLISTAERCNFEKDVRFLSNSLAIACTIRGLYDKALKYSYKSLELREQRGNNEEIAIAQNVVGTTFYSIGIYDRAAEFLKKSLATSTNHEYVPDLKITLALCYANLNYPNESRALVQAVINEHSANINRRTWPRIYYALGLADWRQYSLESAKGRFIKAYELAKLESDKNLMSDCLSRLGDVYISGLDLPKAEKALLKSDSIASEIGYRNGTEVANLLLARLYSLKNDHVNASVAKSKVIALRDSSISQGVFDNIFRYQFDYYEKQHTKTIATQSELLSLKEQTIKYHLVLNTVSLACATLMVAVIALLYRRNKLKKQIAIDLGKRVQERTQDLRAFDEALRRSKLERTFLLEGIARRLAASLATFKGLSVVSRTYKEFPPEFTDNLDKSSDVLNLLLEVIERSKS
jgi:tetratricopeptide (TPR) repeat protein